MYINDRKELEEIKKFKQIVESQQAYLDQRIKTHRTLQSDLNYYVSLWENKPDLPRHIEISNIEV